MQTRQLGHTDLQVPVICLGTMTWGQQNSEKDAHQQLDYAVEKRGIKFIDTAEVYPFPVDAKKQGSTETYIGNWLKKRGKRDDLIIATKVAPSNMIQTRPTGTNQRVNRETIEQAIEGSLKRLQTDYVDLYQVHWPERNTNYFGARGYDHDPKEDYDGMEETLTVLGELQKAGKIRHIGVSNETPWGIAEYLRLSREKDLPRIVSTQNQYSLTNRTYEVGLAEMTIREQVGLLVYSAIGMGVLSGKYLDGNRPEGARYTVFTSGASEERYNPERAQPAVAAYVEVAKKNGLDPAAMAIAFAASRSFTTSVIIGTRTMDQLKVCIDAGELELSQTVLDEIEAVYQQHPDIMS